MAGGPLASCLSALLLSFASPSNGQLLLFPLPRALRCQPLANGQPGAKGPLTQVKLLFSIPGPGLLTTQPQALGEAQMK